MRRLLLPLPFAVPPVVHAMYEPINRDWTVKRFGCGCPQIDGTWPFNANDFNLILWILVLSACTCAFVVAVRHGVRKWRYEIIGVGFAVLLALCLKMYGRECWL